jgi:hypothetical protein
MESNELVNQVAKAVLEGRLSWDELAKAIKENKEIPEDIITALHTLFCTRPHGPDACTFYNELNLENRIEKAGYKKWEGLARLYIEAFDSTVEDLREEIRFLKEVMCGGPSKPRHMRILSLYLVAFIVNSDDKLFKFIDIFIKKLNTVDDRCTCVKQPGEFITVADLSNPTCPKCYKKL